MATGKSRPAGRRPRDRQPSRWKRNGALLVAVVAAVALAFGWAELRREALASTAYAARVGCSCRFVSRLPLDQCAGALQVAGLGRTARLTRLTEDAGRGMISASVPLLARQSAAYAPGTGCQLEAWKD